MTLSRRTLGRLIATFAAALALAAPAFGATPSEIYKDYADNGRLDANYSKTELKRMFQDATVQGYGRPVVVAKMKQKSKPTGGLGSPVTATKMKQKSKPTSGVKGKKTPPSGVEKARGGLPFTGAQLGLFGVVGLSLVGSGVLLRLTGRKKSG